MREGLYAAAIKVFPAWPPEATPFRGEAYGVRLLETALVVLATREVRERLPKLRQAAAPQRLRRFMLSSGATDLMIDPRVEHGVNQISQQICDDYSDRHQQRQPHQHWVVAQRDGV